ncbi:hypothetical protein D3C85_1521490 [compost metagenome]
MIGWLAATPGLRASRFPTPEHAADDVIQKQHIPAVPGTWIVAWHVETVDVAVWYR